VPYFRKAPPRNTSTKNILPTCVRTVFISCNYQHYTSNSMRWVIISQWPSGVLSFVQSEVRESVFSRYAQNLELKKAWGKNCCNSSNIQILTLSQSHFSVFLTMIDICSVFEYPWNTNGILVFSLLWEVPWQSSPAQFMSAIHGIIHWAVWCSSFPSAWFWDLVFLSLSWRMLWSQLNNVTMTTFFHIIN
jgi:hypothetical protein